MATTMKAWQYTSAAGGLEKNLTLNKAATPPPSTNLSKTQLLIEVISTSINPIDYKLPEVGIIGKLVIPTPASPGLDFSGRVISTAHDDESSKTPLKKGDKVFGRLDGPSRFGTCGQFVVADVSGCVLLPDGVNEDQAACIGTAGLTAYQCLAPHVRAGSHVFINGGSGGTGTFGIQMAKILGAGKVTTTCSTANVQLCRELGADVVIDYKHEDVVDVLKRGGLVFDVVVDNVGFPASLYKESHHFLKPGCRFVQVGAPISVGSIVNMVSRMVVPGFVGGGKRPYSFAAVKNRKEDFAEMGKWMAEGKLKAVVDQVFEWEDVPKAFEKLKTGRAKGKIIVHVTDK